MGMNTFIFRSILIVLVLVMTCFNSVNADENAAENYLQSVKGERAKLRQFMQAFPKGGDLRRNYA
jgi:hypothetical protein